MMIQYTTISCKVEATPARPGAEADAIQSRSEEAASQEGGSWT
jgi:hypothetical protein